MGSWLEVWIMMQVIGAVVSILLILVILLITLFGALKGKRSNGYTRPKPDYTIPMPTRQPVYPPAPKGKTDNANSKSGGWDEAKNK